MLILFDIDGTLVDDGAATAAGVGALYSYLHPPVSLSEFAVAWQEALDTHFERFDIGEIDFLEQRRARVRDVVGSYLDDAAADDLFAVYLDAHESAWRLYDDVIVTLDALSGHHLGIVSNGQGAQQRAKLERLGIADRFDPVLVSAEVGMRKPSPDIFAEACARAGVHAREALHVGDRYSADALGARSAGLLGVWLDRMNARTGTNDGPVINSLTGLIDIAGPA